MLDGLGIAVSSLALVYPGIIPLFKRSCVLNSRTSGFCTISPPRLLPSLKFVPTDPIESMPELSPLYLREPTLEQLPRRFAGGV